MNPIPWTAWIYLLVCVFAIVDALFGVRAVGAAAMALSLLFIAVESPRAPRIQQIVGTVLATLGLLIGFGAGDLVGTFLSGVRRTLPFFVLFCSVVWMQAAAARSPAIQAVRDFAAGQPPGRRFLMISLFAHVLGAAFNLAGISLLATLISQHSDRSVRIRLARALTQGFSSCACWSPFFVGTSVILSLLPGVRWVEIAPFGLAIAAVLITTNWWINRTPAPQRDPGDPPAPKLPAWALRNLAITLLILFGLLIGSVESTGISIPIALGLVAPAFTILWNRAASASSAEGPLDARTFVAGVIARFANLRSEAILFTSANIFGAGISIAIPQDAAGRLLDAVAIPVDLRIFLLAMFISLCGAMGLHPVVLVVVIVHVLPPAVMGIPPEAMALIMLATWGLGTSVSPFSATSLYVSRLSGESIWTVAWRLNLPFGLAATAISAILVILVRHSGVF